MDSSQRLEQLALALDRVYSSPKELMKRGLLVGLFTGIGATIGASLVILAMGLLVRSLGGLPVIGDWLNTVSNSLPK